VRAIGLDVHRDFCEVAIAEQGNVRSAGRIATRPELIELFAQSLASDDRVALEVTGNAWEIARIIEPHVARVVVVSPSDTGIRQARAKTDRLDARTLAKLLAAGSLDSVWMPDERTRVMRRRLSRRSQLVEARTRVKNEIHAILIRRLKGRPDVSDLFGKTGRAWLAELELPIEERETLDSGVRQIDFLDAEVASVDRVLAHDALNWPQARRLMTVPGVNLIAAATFLAAVGNIERFPDRRKLVAYLGLDPKVRQSGDAPAAHGHISKQGSAAVRVALVEASWSAVRQPGPLRAFYRRVRARRGHHVAITATARKLACLFWVLGPALAPTGLRLRPALADGQEAAPAGDHRRRAALARAPRRLDRSPPAPRRRTRSRPTSRTGLRPDRPRPPSRRRDQGGRECDTGARITTAHKGQSRAADHKPLTSALRYVSHSHPPQRSHSRPRPASRI
jgi:transposase